jgi:hypothetical protein
MQISGLQVSGLTVVGSTTFVGNTASTASPTLNGTTTTTSNPYSGVTANSYSMNGSTNYLSLPASTNWAFGTGDYTVEWFQYQTSQPANPRVFQVGNYPTTSVGVSIEGAGTFYLWEANTYRFNNSLGTYLNTWIHFAISRISGVTRVFRNGTLMGTSFADTNNITNSTSVFNIGQESTPTASSYFPGYITSFRVCKGLGVYSGNFTTPTGPLGQTASANPYGGSNTNAITTQCVLLLNP